MQTHAGNTQPAIDQEEHEGSITPYTKRVLPYGYDGTSKNLLFVDTNGIQRSIVTIASTLTTSQGLVTLAASPNYIGLVTVANIVKTIAEVVDDTGNSTTTPINANATFTGTGFDLHQYASWSVTIFSDKASATNGLKVQWSNDNSNWDFVDQQTYAASAGNMITFGRKARYVRLVYTNGGTNQTTFRVAAFAQPISVRQTRKFVGNQLVDQDTGQIVIAGLQGHTTAGGGAWVDVKVNPSGALTVDSTFAGNVTLNPSPNWIGLATTTIGSAATIFAVVNTTAASGLATVNINTGAAWIGLATTVIGSAPTLYAVVNTAEGGQATVTLNSIPTVTTMAAPYSFYQQASLISGYTWLGFTAPGSNPTTATFRIQRVTANTGEILFASGTASYIHTWSAASLGSISYS